MKKALLLLIILLLVYCKKEDDSFKYDFKIIRTYSSYDTRTTNKIHLNDSCVSYYDHDKRLLKVDRMNHSAQNFEYSKDYISTNDQTKFYLDSLNRIVEIKNFFNGSKYIYNSLGFHDDQELSENNLNLISEQKGYFDYKGVIRDSFIVQPGSHCNQVNLNTYSDSIAPSFMISNYYGFFELPNRHKYLINTVKTFSNSSEDCFYLHKYLITDNIIVDTIKMFDSNSKENIEIFIHKYELIK